MSRFRGVHVSKFAPRSAGLVCALFSMAFLATGCGPGAGRSEGSATDGALLQDTEEPAQAYLPPPPAAFSGDFVVRGPRDGWRVEISDDQLIVFQENRPPMKAVHGGPRMAGEQAVWAAEAAGEPLIVVLVETPCELERGGASYPYSAEVQVEDQTLDGCAERSPS